jgi:hypothetical protein
MATTVRWRTWLWVLAICGGAAVIGYVALNVFLESIFRITHEKVDANGQKGVDEFQRYSGLTMPAGTTCLKGDFVKWQDWAFNLVFWAPAAPAVPLSLAKKEEIYSMSDLILRMDQVLGPKYPLKNPVPDGRWTWNRKDGRWFTLECVRCDDGYYYLGFIGSG